MGLGLGLGIGLGFESRPPPCQVGGEKELGLAVTEVVERLQPLGLGFRVRVRG